jgi:hypothetical protein
MPVKKTIFILLSLASGICFIPGQISPAPPSPEKWVIVKGSDLQVDGATNISRFSCEIADYCGPDTIVLNNNGIGAGRDQGVTVTGTIGLDVSGFDCHNAMMTSELRKTLKAAIFPRLYIHFLSLSRMPDPGLRKDSLKGLVEIELAGVTRRMEINYTVSAPDRKLILLTGNQQIKFSDFRLVAPRKLGGMIRTSDKLEIGFHLDMKAIN